MYTHRGNPIRFKYYNRIITVYSLKDSFLAKRNMKYSWLRDIKNMPLTERGGGGESLLSSPLPTFRLFTSSFISVSPKNCIWKTKDRNFCVSVPFPAFHPFSLVSRLFPNSLFSCLSTSRTPVGLLISRLAKALDRRLTHLDRPIVNNLILIKLLTWSVNFSGQI